MYRIYISTLLYYFSTIFFFMQTIPQKKKIKAHSHSHKVNVILIDKKIPGKKILVVDPDVIGPLNLSIENSTLKEHGIYKIFYLEPEVKKYAKKLII